MRLVVDSNVLFSALVKDSVTRSLLLHAKVEFITLRFSVDEILKYKQEIIRKAYISHDQFRITFSGLMQKIIIVEDKVIMAKIPDAAQVMDKIDPKDTPFLAAAMATDSDLWSNDTDFEKQKKVKVWKTHELVNLV